MHGAAGGEVINDERLTIQSPAHRNHLPSDIGAHIRSEKNTGIRHVVAGAKALERDSREISFFCFFVECVGHFGGYKAGRYRVTADAPGAIFLCNGF